MTCHELKVELAYYERIRSGEKTAELRRNDRDYQVGDVLRLTPGVYVRNEFMAAWRPAGKSSPPLTARISHILSSFEGLKNGWCVLSLSDVTIEQCKGATSK